MFNVNIEFECAFSIFISTSRSHYLAMFNTCRKPFFIFAFLIERLLTFEFSGSLICFSISFAKFQRKMEKKNEKIFSQHGSIILNQFRIVKKTPLAIVRDSIEIVLFSRVEGEKFCVDSFFFPEHTGGADCDYPMNSQGFENCYEVKSFCSLWSEWTFMFYFEWNFLHGTKNMIWKIWKEK